RAARSVIGGGGDQPGRPRGPAGESGPPGPASFRAWSYNRRVNDERGHGGWEGRRGAGRLPGRDAPRRTGPTAGGPPGTLPAPRPEPLPHPAGRRGGRGEEEPARGLRLEEQPRQPRPEPRADREPVAEGRLNPPTVSLHAPAPVPLVGQRLGALQERQPRGVDRHPRPRGLHHLGGLAEEAEARDVGRAAAADAPGG